MRTLIQSVCIFIGGFFAGGTSAFAQSTTTATTSAPAPVTVFVPATPDIPSTGDESQLLLWIVGLAALMLGAVIVYLYATRENA